MENERKRNTELEVAQSDKHCAVTSLVVPSARDNVWTDEYGRKGMKHTCSRAHIMVYRQTPSCTNALGSHHASLSKCMYIAW